MSDLSEALEEWSSFRRVRLAASLTDWEYEAAWSLIDRVDQIAEAAREHLGCNTTLISWCETHRAGRHVANGSPTPEICPLADVNARRMGRNPFGRISCRFTIRPLGSPREDR